MKKNKLIFVVLVLIFNAHYNFAQYPLKFKKVSKQFLFYKQGKANDTINNKCLFTLVVPDSLKPHFSLKITNGRIEAVKGDTVYQWYYLPGLNYELLFVKEEKQHEKIKSDEYKPHCLINGANLELKNYIELECFNRKEGVSILKNKFILKN